MKRDRMTRGVGVRAVAEVLEGRVLLAGQGEELGVEGVGHWGGLCGAVAVSGSYAYFGHRGDLEVVDAGNPTQPRKIGALAVDVADAYVVGSMVYIVSGSGGLPIVDVSDPCNPVRVGGCDTSGRAYGVFVAGSLAYVADSEAGLQIVDVATPVIRLAWAAMTPAVVHMVFSSAGHWLMLRTRMRVCRSLT